MRERDRERELTVDEMANLLISIDKGKRVNSDDKERLYNIKTEQPDIFHEARIRANELYPKKRRKDLA